MHGVACNGLYVNAPCNTADVFNHLYASNDSLYRASSKDATLFKLFMRHNSIPRIVFADIFFFFLFNKCRANSCDTKKYSEQFIREKCNRQ